jgi:hypothetical protein
VDDLGAGLFELYAKAPIEKRQKSQEVDTESVYFFWVSQNQKMHTKTASGIDVTGSGGEASMGSKIIIHFNLS